MLMFLISLSLVSANNYSKSDGLNWLSTSIPWGTAPIEEVSFALLALDSSGYSTGTGLNFLQSRADASGCYASTATGSCTSKDTALAALTLSELGVSITSQLVWINQTLKQANIEGDWMIQIIPGSGEGGCNFTHEGSSTTIEIEGASEWVSVENDLSITINEPLELINVDCDLPSNTKISLLRQGTGSEFYIIDENTGNNVDIIVNSACYSSTTTGICDEESTFYVSWVLNELNQEVDTMPYLQDIVSSGTNNVYYAMMQSISPSQEYVSNLINNQNTAGYWPYTASNIYATSFVIDALYSSSVQTEVDNAVEWLENQQINSGINKGSWNNGNVLDTAVALYLGLTQAYGGGGGGDSGVGFCSDGTIQSPNYNYEFEECDDGNLISGDGCNSFCETEGDVECTTDAECTNIGEICNLQTNTCGLRPDWCLTNANCNPNEICDTTANTCILPLVYCETNTDCEYYEYCDTTTNLCETSQGYCATSLECFGSNTCDPITHTCVPMSSGEGDGYPDGYSEYGEKPSGAWWIWLIIIIVILIGGIFAYMKLSKPKKPKSPSFLESQRPERPSQFPSQSQYQSPRVSKSPRDNQLEMELDKSIKEAQNLLKKK